ncbi:MAG: hypothetical protein ACOC22_02200 [bacterium]
MSYIETLLENDSVKEFATKNEEVIKEAEEKTNQFRAFLKEFVLNNPKEFLAESLNETKKNIRTFSEVATAQFLAEVSSYYSSKTESEEPVVENEEGGLGDYL